MQIAQTNRFWVKTTINRGHTLGPLKNTYPCDPTRKMQTAETNRVWVKTTTNRGYILGLLKNTYPCDPTRKCKLPKQTEFGSKQPSTEDTSSGLAQHCEHQPLLHRLTNKKNTYNRQKNKNKEDKQMQGTNY